MTSLIQTGSSAGIQSKDQHLMRLIEVAWITSEAIYEKAIDKHVFLKVLDELLLTV